MAAFNLSLSSVDFNYNQAPIPDFNVTLEDNDDGRGHLMSCEHLMGSCEVM